jgi:hypothetical protein
MWWCWLACALGPAPVERGGPELAEAAVRAVSRSPDGLVEAWIEPGSSGATVWRSVDGVGSVVWRGASADRLALSPVGHAAFVASIGGVPSVVIAPLDQPARQLTNMGLAPAKGGPPEGFVPPPVHEGGLRFDGASLRWLDPQGHERVVRWEAP